MPQFSNYISKSMPVNNSFILVITLTQLKDCHSINTPASENPPVLGPSFPKPCIRSAVAFIERLFLADTALPCSHTWSSFFLQHIPKFSLLLGCNYFNSSTPIYCYKFSFMSDKYINDAMRLSNSIFSISVVFASIYFLFVYLNLECKYRFVINFQSIGYLLNERKVLLKLFLQYETVHSIQKNDRKSVINQYLLTAKPKRYVVPQLLKKYIF